MKKYLFIAVAFIGMLFVTSCGVTTKAMLIFPRLQQ